MKTSWVIISFVFAVLSLMAGWWFAGLSASQKPDTRDQWGDLKGAEFVSEYYAKTAQMLHASDIFPISRAEADRRDAIEAQGAADVVKDVPKFPTIIGASILNNVPHIHLQLQDKSLLKAKSGDTLESGWQLISVDLQRVSAVYGEETQDFWVTDYDVKASSDKE